MSQSVILLYCLYFNVSTFIVPYYSFVLSMTICQFFALACVQRDRLNKLVRAVLTSLGLNTPLLLVRVKTRIDLSLFYVLKVSLPTEGFSGHRNPPSLFILSLACAPKVYLCTEAL